MTVRDIGQKMMRVASLGLHSKGGKGHGKIVCGITNVLGAFRGWLTCSVDGSLIAWTAD